MSLEKFPIVEEKLDPQGNPMQELPGCEENEPYALMVLGDSMEPEFREGDVIVIEPNASVQDGSYIIAFHNNEHIFRQLKVVGERLFIQPLNPAYAAEQLSGPEAIKGKITQKKSPGGRHNRKNYD